MSNICPITFEKTINKYSEKALKKFSSKLKNLNDFPFSAEEQRAEALFRSSRMSIQGAQAKLSVKLNLKEENFEIADIGGTYIFKPQSELYKELPENEALTMTLASVLGIETPFHGLICSSDSSFTYFIKRFDRYGRNKKYALEDFAQLSGMSRDTKYNSSYENVISIIEKYTSFPMIEKQKFFVRFLFCFLTGNEDMHLKNFSLITRENKVELSPAYDFVNSTIAMKNAEHEIALTLNGRTKKITKKILFNYLAKERLGLPPKVIQDIKNKLSDSYPIFIDIIGKSMLSDEMKTKYLKLLDSRRKRILEND